MRLDWSTQSSTAALTALSSEVEEVTKKVAQELREARSRHSRLRCVATSVSTPCFEVTTAARKRGGEKASPLEPLPLRRPTKEKEKEKKKEKVTVKGEEISRTRRRSGTRRALTRSASSHLSARRTILACTSSSSSDKLHQSHGSTRTKPVLLAELERCAAVLSGKGRQQRQPKAKKSKRGAVVSAFRMECVSP